MSAVQYSALPTSLEDNSDEKLTSPASSKRTSSRDRFVLYSTIGTILLTLLSLSLSLRDHFHPPHPSPSARTTQVLRRPNPFPNPQWLREIAKIHNRTFDPIVNIAPLSFQMQVGDKKRKIVEDVSRERDTPQGRVWPDDRRFFVNSTTATVMQFRNRDFDMERCVLTLSIPALSAVLDPAAHLSNHSGIEVWALDNTREIHPSIFWGTAPKRTGLLTTFHVNREEGRKWESDPFRCKATGFTTLEFVCGGKHGKEGEGCHVEFWQDREKPFGGVYVVQHHAGPDDQI